MQIYVSQNSGTLGPFEKAQAQELLRDGSLSADDLACCEGDEQWVRLSELLVRVQSATPSIVAAQAKVAQKGSQLGRQPTRVKSLLIQFAVVFLATVLGGAALIACWQYLPGRTRKLEGEVFIVTKGGESVKLGLVEVSLFSLASLSPYLADKTAAESKVAAHLEAQVKAAAMGEKNREDYYSRVHALLSAGDRYAIARFEQWAKIDVGYDLEYDYAVLLRKWLYFPLGDYYFSDLPQPQAKTQTDADGKFKIEVPTKGEFALGAFAQRSVGASVEKYFWLVRISRDRQTEKVMLSNGNLSSSGSSDSLIVTKK